MRDNIGVARAIMNSRKVDVKQGEALLATVGDSPLDAFNALRVGVQSSPFKTPPYPTDEHRALIKVQDAAGLLAETDDAIRHNDQPRAAAAIQIYGDRGYPVDPVFELMLKYAISEDGRLHGEKYFHTVREEYKTIRPAFRWRQIVALARVTASEYGYDRNDKHGTRAPGYEDACRLLGVDA